MANLINPRLTRAALAAALLTSLSCAPAWALQPAAAPAPAAPSVGEARTRDATAAERRQLTRAVEALARAALEGDVDAYMALQDRGRAEHFAERAAWARTLRAEPLSVYELEIDFTTPVTVLERQEAGGVVLEAEVGLRESVLGRAEGDGSERAPARANADADADKIARVTRQLRGEEGGDENGAAGNNADGEPRRAPAEVRRSYAYPVRFVKRGDQWLLAGEAWEVIEVEPGVRVRAPLATFDEAPMVAEEWARVRAHVERELGFDAGVSPRSPLPLAIELLPRDGADWRPDGDSTSDLDGWYSPDGVLAVLIGDADLGDDLLGTLTHEYTHAVHAAMVRDFAFSPSWMDEGLAQLVEELFGSNVALVGRDVPEARVTRRSAIDWDELAEVGPLQDEWVFVYTQGYSMLRFVHDTFGRERRNRWVLEVGRDGDLDRASRAALGVSWVGLRDRWRETLPAE